VDEEKLRFDFSWNTALTVEQIASVEKVVQEMIATALPVYAQVVPFAEADKIVSLRKVFGEKYPDPVRVISVGESVENLISNPQNPSWSGLSIEFCGGTHLTNTNQAEDFVIVEESGIAKGIRRITGLTRGRAKSAKERAAALIGTLEAMESVSGSRELNEALKGLKFDVDQASVSLSAKNLMRTKISKIIDNLKVWRKEDTARRVAEASAQAEKIATSSKDMGDKVIVGMFEFGSDGKVAKKIYEQISRIHPSASVMIISLDEDGDKVSVNAFTTPEHVGSGLSAKDWCDELMKECGGGRGGGKPTMATVTIAGGNQTNLRNVYEVAKSYACSIIS